MDRAIKIVAWFAVLTDCALIVLMEMIMWQSVWSLLLLLLLPMLGLSVLAILGKQIKALAWYSAVMAFILSLGWVGITWLMMHIFTEGGPIGLGEVALTMALPIVLILPSLGLAVLILIKSRGSRVLKRDEVLLL